MRTPPPQLPEPAPQPLLPPFPRQLTRRRPLPDAVAIRRLRLPDGAPPYDDLAGDDRADDDRGGGERAGDEATAAWTGPGETGSGETGPARTEPEPARREPAETRAGQGPVRPGRDVAAGTGEWPSQFAQALAEALAGARPARQVQPWTTEQTRRRIRQLGPLLQADQRPRVRRVRTSVPGPGVVEMTVIIGIGPRVRALAVRLEQAGPDRAHPGRPRQWLCTAIEAA
jgi:Family of unknown function (DUF6459)